MPKRPNGGYLLHEDNERVVIVTDDSHNAKTGDMLQVWILARHESPVDTIRNGHDSVICGDCQHGGSFASRTCYVTIHQAPQAVWRAYQRGSYPVLHRGAYPDVFHGRVVRWGAYGDPALIPPAIVYWVNFSAKSWTGYTHMWKTPTAAPFRHHLMASVDSVVEYRDAKAAGWRTFRVYTSSPLEKGEITCPASDEAGHRTQCVDCKLCNGVRYFPGDPRKDIAIQAHGAGKSKFIQIEGGLQ